MKKTVTILDRNRYMELKYHCMQYTNWENALIDTRECKDSLNKNNLSYNGMCIALDFQAKRYQKLVDEINESLNNVTAFDKLSKENKAKVLNALGYGIISGLSYKNIIRNVNIKSLCSVKLYYEGYREFFLILNKKLDGIAC